MSRVSLFTNTAMLCPHACGRFYYKLCRILHGFSHLKIQARIRKNLTALFDVCSFEAQDDGHGDMEVARGGDYAGGQAIHTEDAAEDVDEDGLDVGVGEKDFEGVFDLLLGCAAAHIKEVGGAAAGVLDNVHGGHGQARAVDHAGDGAVELDVVERVLAGLDFKRVFFGRVAQSLDLGVAEEGIVVEGDLGVEREELVVFGGDEGIDLDQRGVGLDEGFVEALEECDGGGDLRGLKTEGKGQLAGLPCAKADGRIDGFLEDGLGIFGGHFFNLHAAGLGGHEDQPAGGAVEDDAEIKLAVDGRGLLDEQALDLLSERPGLMSDERHAEDILGVQLGLLASASDLDATALAAASGVNLRLDHNAACALGEELAGHRGCFFEVVGHFAPGHGNAVFRQDFFRLILVNLPEDRKKVV